MKRYPLVETVKFRTNELFFAKFDMAQRGPKVLTQLAPTWSREHAEIAKSISEIRAAARRRYGRS